MTPAESHVSALLDAGAGAPSPSVDPEDPIDVVERVLERTHARHWPVAHDRELLGMIALGDLLAAQQPETDEERAHRVSPLKAAHLMSRARVVGSPADSAARAAQAMRRHRVSCLPIVDNGRLLGVITLDDMVRHAIALLEEYAEAYGTRAAASRLMTWWPIAHVHPFARLEEAEAMMRSYAVRHLPVVRLGHVVGIVSDRDVLEAHRRFDGCDQLVGDAMTAAPITIEPDTDAVEAAHTLIDRRVGALPVLRRELLLGILTKGDFLEWVSLLGCAED
jgi:CBS domain-containing protein